MTEKKQLDRANELLLAVLHFHRGGAWTEADLQLWFKRLGTYQCTTKALCNAIRDHLKECGY